MTMRGIYWTRDSPCQHVVHPLQSDRIAIMTKNSKGHHLPPESVSRMNSVSAHFKFRSCVGIPSPSSEVGIKQSRSSKRHLSWWAKLVLPRFCLDGIALQALWDDGSRPIGRPSCAHIQGGLAYGSIEPLLGYRIVGRGLTSCDRLSSLPTSPAVVTAFPHSIVVISLVLPPLSTDVLMPQIAAVGRWHSIRSCSPLHPRVPSSCDDENVIVACAPGTDSCLSSQERENTSI
ncbi:hypothetical protein V8B97DRAFT_1242458 [Scleroderma yunnanense]